MTAAKRPWIIPSFLGARLLAALVALAALPLLFSCPAHGETVSIQRTSGGILEITQNDLPLFDVAAATGPDARVHVIINQSIDNSDMFVINNDGKLTLRPGLSATERKKFDYETHPVVSVNIRSTNVDDQSDVVLLTVNLTLTDANDEPPVFTTQPVPYLAVVARDPQPGTSIFNLKATDPDTDADLRMSIASVTPQPSGSGFAIVTVQDSGNSVTYNLRTLGTNTFPADEVYTVQIEATDEKTVSGYPDTAIARVLVKVGRRPPQIYQTKYNGYIYETTSTNTNKVLSNGDVPLKIDFKQFQSGPTSIQLLRNGVVSNTFRIDGNREISNMERVMYSESDFRRSLTIRVTENPGTADQLFSEASLEIDVKDENDNYPVFTQNYYTSTVRENVPINSVVVTVQASDADAGENGNVTFALVNAPNFYVTTSYDPSINAYIGDVRVLKELDYDTGDTGGTYSFIVKASDQGPALKSATATIAIATTNVNDNPPIIPNTVPRRINLLETAQIDSVVFVVQATDLDGDKVQSFEIQSVSPKNIFTIDQQGIVRLRENIGAGVEEYVMTVKVTDDGSCCGTSDSLSSTAIFTIVITDINRNRPDFVTCSGYDRTTVDELSPIGTSVVQVSARDPDRGENGRVIYSLIEPNPVEANAVFQINSTTGEITVKRVFERDSAYVQVTVKGSNPGTPVMEGWCTFRVIIEDINNHAPSFLNPSMDVSLPRNTGVGGRVVTVRATDQDVGVNARIKYTLTSTDPNATRIFEINEVTGMVTLKADLPAAANFYRLTVVATDMGVKPGPKNGSMELNIVITGESQIPVWQPHQMRIAIDEVTAPGDVLATFYCSPNQPGDPPVEFVVYEETISIASSVFGQRTYPTPENSYYRVDLIKKDFQVFDVDKEYQVTISCRIKGQDGLADITPTFIINDDNNKVPKFQGLDGCCYTAYISENAGPGTTVKEVSATDDDVVPPNNVVTFSLNDASDAVNFEVIDLGDNRGAVIAKAAFTNKLDRETRDKYEISIRAEDGAPADPNPNPNMPGAPNIAVRALQIIVMDVNDNAPFFARTSYVCNASETLTAGEKVCNVTAQDLDQLDIQGLQYYFSSGALNAFSVVDYSGDIIVNGKLDYENDLNPKVYILTLVAKDGVDQTATTSVTINVIDMNDNRPVFERNPYIVTDMFDEEDETYTQENPLLLVTVKATDADKDRDNQIRYNLLGSYTDPGPNQKFTINTVTGQIYLVGPLDREETDNPTFSFNVRAYDELVNPNVGYTTVQVTPRDINDQKPLFVPESLHGSVAEHSPKESSVCQVLATDKDDGINAAVTFEKAPNQVNETLANYFKIDSNGLVRTNTDAANLDRETIQEILVVLIAKDSGIVPLSSTGTLTVTLTDINDQIPIFPQPLYRFGISENTRIGTIETIEAFDADEKPRLFYSMTDLTNTFSVNSVNNRALIILDRELDYESGDREFNMTLNVKDMDVTHTASTEVSIYVMDFNDLEPVFGQRIINVTLTEEQPAGERVATFNATDGDGTSPNNLFTFAVDPDSDPLFEFYIDPNSGVVTTRKSLDREKGATRTIYIWAIDEGETPNTATGTLYVTLKDVNDNAPEFKDDYQPHLQENVNYQNHLVVQVMAKDPDASPFGGPFFFYLPNPCTNPACTKFTLQYIRGGDQNRGAANIRTTGRFDRELQKQYFLPIVIRDMYQVSETGFMSATSTLTITIGDENDNPPKPGRQEVFTYVLGGVSKERMEIGRTYVDDPDDWDLPDKTFTYLSPPELSSYFIIDKDTGMVTLEKDVPVPADGRVLTFLVNVFDKKHKMTVTCTVAVTLATLTEQAAHKAGAMRISGMTGAQFITPPPTPANAKSKLALFEEQMAAILGYPETGQHVQVVSVNEVGPDLDVRFAAHGSPYLNPAQVESAVMLNKAKLESNVIMSVQHVPINLCKVEMQSDGCYTDVNVTGRSHLTNANGTSFVGAEAIISAKSGCKDSMFPLTNECNGDYCFNGGTCTKDDWGKLSCQCSAGFDGPRCQQRSHHFDGNSVAFYHNLEACADGRTSIEFITEENNGVILFSGPGTNIDLDKDIQDYILLELIDGYPHLRVNLGAGETTLMLTGRNVEGVVRMNKLSDGHWHRIDIDKDKQLITMTVDFCGTAEVMTDGMVNDWTPCLVRGIVPGGEILLNTQGFLQLGNRYPMVNRPTYPASIGAQGFKGCIRNLVHNTKLYDLSFKVMPGFDSGQNGCPKEAAICGIGNAAPACGVNAMCESQWLPSASVVKCTCHPGWYGDKCQFTTPIKDFEDESFLKWSLQAALIDESVRDQSIDIMFRTRQTAGNLFTMTNANQRSILLELKDGHLSVRYDLGEGIREMTLMNSMASTGQWHVARLERHGSEVSISMDGGEGRNFNYQPLDINERVEFRTQPYVSAGANLPPVQGNVQTADIANDLINTCVQDIRFDENWLPMNRSFSVNNIALVDERKVVSGCFRDDCNPDPCREGQCYPLWEMFQCRCPAGLLELASGLCPSPCAPNPCFNDVPCTVVDDTVKCTCEPGWIGQYCNALAVADGGDDDGLNEAAIAGIVVAILVLLILIIVIIILFLKCRTDDDEKMIVKVDPDDDFIRENVMFYDDEGAGEMDNEGYDISVLTVPNDRINEAPIRPSNQPMEHQLPNRKGAPQEPFNEVDSRPDVGSFIDKRIDQAEDPNADPFTDSVHQYDYEGGNSEAGSLSSLNTTSSDGSQDYDFLGDWGHKFARLADMYGAGQNLDAE